MPEKRKHLENVLLPASNRINESVKQADSRISKILHNYDNKNLHILMSKMSLKYSKALVKNVASSSYIYHHIKM